jgi:methylmalonyl-CoA/ethylmalonyl-CoA epimerase
MEKAKFDYLKKGIGQVAILVPDLEKAVKAYWDQFGIGPWQFFTYQAPLLKKMSYRGKPGDYAFRIALAWIGELRIELIELISGNTIHAEFIKKHGYGVHHFGLIVNDMEKALATAKDNGIEMIMDGAGFGLAGDGHFAYLDTEDSLGVTLELIQRPRERVKPDKTFPTE